MAACLERDDTARILYDDDPDFSDKRGCPRDGHLSALYNTDDTNPSDEVTAEVVYLFDPIGGPSHMATVLRFDAATRTLVEDGNISCEVFGTPVVGGDET